MSPEIAVALLHQHRFLENHALQKTQTHKNTNMMQAVYTSHLILDTKHKKSINNRKQRTPKHREAITYCLIVLLQPWPFVERWGRTENCRHSTLKHFNYNFQKNSNGISKEIISIVISKK